MSAARRRACSAASLTRRTAAAAATALLASTLAGCASRRAEEGPPVIATVAGVAMYVQRIGLPPGTAVIAQLIDASAPQTPKPVIGEQSQREVAQLPVRFRVDFDARKIDPEHTYLLQVVVRQGERLLFVPRGLYPVVSRGYPTEVEVLLDDAP